MNLKWPEGPLQDGKPRCDWAYNSAIEADYHDREWGVPQFDDRRLFEFLILEGAQAGLAWYTILKKRAAFRVAFDHFDAARIAGYDDVKVAELMANADIVRNRLKINAAITNAQRFLAVQEEFDSFQRYIWGFVGGQPIVNAWPTMADIPVTTAESDAMSKDLKQRGFKFVGSTICYAYMQATGMVNDHLTECICYAEGPT